MSATIHRLPEAPEPTDHELLTVAQFAARVQLKSSAVYKRIRLGRMPPGSVVLVLGRKFIDWTVFKRSIKPVN